MGENRRGSLGRARWAAMGAAVAVALGAGGIGISNATISSGEKDAFVPITPCRLFDTRSTSPVGPRNTPLGVGESYTQTVWGTNGNCTLPTDATAVAMNVTAVGGTAASFLTIWPSDVPRPLASSLNWIAGSPPTPNKVDVRLSADGKINLFNNLGTVNVLADVVGYYADHNHDDRYYTKTQIDTALTSDIVMSHGMFFFLNATSTGTIQNFTDTTRLPFGAISEMQLVGPKNQSGVAFGLKSVTYCMRLASGTAFVNIAQVAGSAPIFDAASDATDRTLAGCYEITVNDPVSTSFTLDLFIGGTTGFVDVLSVTSTWTPVGLIPASFSAAGVPSGEGLAP